ncbi:glutathione peroxidase [Edaphobacter sp. 12200R-103]|jgi:glutathione peroxidase|uniref:glutathione peroxidase n=1 Tax=Edaphobacter sp. 12200R-103 TaxID=2703788 RepID=UPI00138B87DE|nr:glutathione peroxidase [Edaphobacter sp. 12200R-103]QHS51898.1 glutathione peroxidase [Edaphobacter sp. 12200R-103]
MTNLYEIPVKRISGEGTSLGEYRGKVLLIVNVASQCGLTPQYEALEKLSSRFKDAGLVVCGFPANDFGAQEPGSNEEIASFCRTNYSVDFPMFAKIAVTGPDTHPLYQALIQAQPQAAGETRSGFRERLNGFLSEKQNGATTNPDPGILWNFEKFLVDRHGNAVERFSPEIVPDDVRVIAAIEAALKN